MKITAKYLITMLLGLSLCMCAIANDYQKGFNEGYKIVKGDLTIVPIAPVKPVTPVGSTDQREGIKAGMRAAKESKK